MPLCFSRKNASPASSFPWSPDGANWVIMIFSMSSRRSVGSTRSTRSFLGTVAVTVAAREDTKELTASRGA